VRRLRCVGLSRVHRSEFAKVSSWLLVVRSRSVRTKERGKKEKPPVRALGTGQASADSGGWPVSRPRACRATERGSVRLKPVLKTMCRTRPAAVVFFGYLTIFDLSEIGARDVGDTVVASRPGASREDIPWAPRMNRDEPSSTRGVDSSAHETRLDVVVRAQLGKAAAAAADGEAGWIGDIVLRRAVCNMCRRRTPRSGSRSSACRSRFDRRLRHRFEKGKIEGPCAVIWRNGDVFRVQSSGRTIRVAGHGSWRQGAAGLMV